MNDTPKPCCFRPTPGDLVALLLIVECLLWVSNRLDWPTWHKGYAVLSAVVTVGVAFIAMLFWFVVALFHRWRFQFSIRSLLAMVVVVAIPCSWMTMEMKRARLQREATKLIAALNCRVLDDEETDENGEIDLHKQIAKLWRMTVQTHSEQPLIELLGWDFFHAATAVEYDDSGFHVIVGNRVEKLGTRDRAQAVLLALKNLPCLRAVDLSHTPICDSDLAHVIPLKELRQLDLQGTQVTTEGVKTLQQALPNCRIIR